MRLAWEGWKRTDFKLRSQLMHEAARSLTREPVANEVAPGIWVGRRPRIHELPAGVAPAPEVHRPPNYPAWPAVGQGAPAATPSAG